MDGRLSADVGDPGRQGEQESAAYELTNGSRRSEAM
jgi:hypothetical protein